MKYTFSKPFAKELKKLPKSVVEDFSEALKEVEKISLLKICLAVSYLRPTRKIPGNATG